MFWTAIHTLKLAEALNISIGTSKSNLSRAKQLLRKKLENKREVKMIRA